MPYNKNIYIFVKTSFFLKVQVRFENPRVYWKFVLSFSSDSSMNAVNLFEWETLTTAETCAIIPANIKNWH